MSVGQILSWSVRLLLILVFVIILSILSFFFFSFFSLLFLNEAGLGLTFIYIAVTVGFRIVHPLGLDVSSTIIAIVLVLHFLSPLPLHEEQDSYIETTNIPDSLRGCGFLPESFLFFFLYC